MKNDLGSKLRRLGVKKGARQLKPTPKPAPAQRSEAAANPAVSLDILMPNGRTESNEWGSYFFVDKVYPLTHKYGKFHLSGLLKHQPRQFAPYLKQTAWPDSFRNCLFLDTETTGLGGAGTIAFMIGAGFFETHAFVVRQYFVRDFGEETAVLFDLATLVERHPTLVSFNGKTFDVPLLQTRLQMNRLNDSLGERAHIDLLHPARRLWRRRLGSVALGALEKQVLGVKRTHEDVPGYLIPSLYHAYMRGGDFRPISRIFYHNRLDILSMVTLTDHILQTLHTPEANPHALDLYSLGKWHIDLDLPNAETYLRQAAKLESDLSTWQQILLELGVLLKRQDRHAEALPFWQQVAHTSTEDVTAHIELAKYYEWRTDDLNAAHKWTKQAQALAPSHDRDLCAEITHRIERIGRKLTTLKSK